MKAVKIGLPIFLVSFTIWLLASPPAQVGYAPTQPINYSHKFHAGELGLDCQYCHTGVTWGKKAGVPSLNVCMNCHSAVGYGNPEIEKLQKMWAEKKSPAWVRVHNLPDHAKFSHAPHIKALKKDNDPSIKACKHCHGDVTKMEVVAQVKDLNMGFCVNCHRDNEAKGAKINCSTCHY